MSPVEYTHVASSPGGERQILVRKPLMWALSYAGYAPARLPELLDARVRGDELQKFIVSHLALQQVVQHQTGLTRLFEALHLRLGTTKMTALGDLPVNCIALAVGTDLPADDVILQSADLTGMDSFEEVVRAATVRPAEAIGLPDLGTLRPGTPADVALFRIHEGRFTFYDVHMNAREGTQLIRNTLTIAGGRPLAIAPDPAPAPWIELSEAQHALIERGHTPEVLTNREENVQRKT